MENNNKNKKQWIDVVAKISLGVLLTKEFHSESWYNLEIPMMTKFSMYM